MEQVKVLHITNYGSPGGGVFRYVSEFIRNSKTDKCSNMKLLSICPSSFSDYSLNANKYDLIINKEMLIKRFEEILDHFKPDIVHIHDITLLLVPILQTIQNKKIRSVVTLHNLTLVCSTGLYQKNNSICNDNNCIRCIFKRPAYCYHYLSNLYAKDNHLFDVPKRYISTSPLFTRIYKKHGFKNIETVQSFVSDIQSYEDNQQGNYVLFVGRLDHEKAPDSAIRIMENTNHRLIIIGNGSMKKKLEMYIKKKNLEKRIILLGFVTGKRLYNYYKKAKIILYPSNWIETSSLVLYEAMANGKTCVVANKGTVSTIIKHGNNGYLYDKEEEATKIINTLFNNKNVCSIIGKRAYRTAKQLFQFKDHYNKIRKIYLSVQKKPVTQIKPEGSGDSL